MSEQLLVMREHRGLVPITARDAEILGEIPLLAEMSATLTMPRSLKANKFYWSLLSKVVANHPFYRRAEALHLWIKVRLGYVDEITFHDARAVTRVTSTAFDKMDGVVWRRFMDRAVDVICDEVLPGISKFALISEIEKMLGLKYDSVYPEGKVK